MVLSASMWKFPTAFLVELWQYCYLISMDLQIWPLISSLIHPQNFIWLPFILWVEMVRVVPYLMKFSDHLSSLILSLCALSAVRHWYVWILVLINLFWGTLSCQSCFSTRQNLHQYKTCISCFPGCPKPVTSSEQVQGSTEVVVP